MRYLEPFIVIVFYTISAFIAATMLIIITSLCFEALTDYDILREIIKPTLRELLNIN